MSDIVKVISCNDDSCPWFQAADCFKLPVCKHPGATTRGIAKRMPRGVPDLCPIKVDGPFLCVASSVGNNVSEVVESVKKQLDQWRDTWVDAIGKQL